MLMLFSVCSAAAVDIIERHCRKARSSAYAYFFFDSRSGENNLSSHDGLIRSLISQLLGQGGKMPDDFTLETQSLRNLQDAFLSVVSGFSHVYIIIDALDECNAAQMPKLLAWIKDISRWDGNKLHILLSSRQEREIEDCLLSISLLDPVYFAAHQPHIDGDIGKFVDRQISDMPDWDEDTRRLVKKTLMKRAGGMYVDTINASGRPTNVFCPGSGWWLCRWKSYPDAKMKRI